MSAAAWQLDGYVARLSAADLRATVDLRNPAAGLLVEWPAPAIQNGPQVASLFELHVAAPSTESDPAAIDCFVRGGDLVATYAETPGRPLRAEVYWRVVAASAESQTAHSVPVPTQIELVVSVQTSRLHMDPAVTVATTLPAAAAVRRLSEAATGQFVDCPVSEGRPQVFEPSTGKGCLLFRGPGPLSYLEMVHPADFRQTKIIGSSVVAGGWHIEHRLFESSVGGLEKGVILRSRLRGMFLPDERDEVLALAEYRRFATSEPPLTV
jgi:hypothetical protein